jgi:hypothetical protein
MKYLSSGLRFSRPSTFLSLFRRAAGALGSKRSPEATPKAEQVAYTRKQPHMARSTVALAHFCTKVRDFRAAAKGYSVPHTGRLRGGRIWRHPRTLSAKRAACAVLNDEMEPPIRPSRRANRLPSVWDDRRIAACGIKNWKRFRKTQYRSAGGPQ